MDPPEEFAVVADVFEHLDGDDPVKALLGFEGIDVFGDDLEVFQSAFPGLPVDMFALGMGIGNGSDLGLRIIFRHPEGEGAPSASEFENFLTIFQSRMFAGEFEGPVFRCGQVADEFFEVTTAVFEVFSEHQLIELGRYFIVLFVCFFREHCHG